MKKEFKVGDRVVGINECDDNRYVIKMPGTVERVVGHHVDVLFDGYIDGWGRGNRMWACDVDVLRHIKKGEKIVPPEIIGVGDDYVFASTSATKKGFNVGCVFVSWKTFDAIGKFRPKTTKRE